MDGPAASHFTAQFVTHRTHAAVFEAAQNDIALVQRTFTNQNGSHRATAFIQEGFDHHAARHTVTDGFQLQNFGLQQDRVQQFVDTGTRFRGHVDELRFRRPTLPA